MIYIMSCVWLDYMIKYFQSKNCEGSSPKTKKCVTSFLVPVYNCEPRMRKSHSRFSFTLLFSFIPMTFPDKRYDKKQE